MRILLDGIEGFNISQIKTLFFKINWLLLYSELNLRIRTMGKKFTTGNNLVFDKIIAQNYFTGHEIILNNF